MPRFKTMIADPAWRYSNRGVNGACEEHYVTDAATQRATMSFEELTALPVDRATADDAVLFLWATWPLLEQAIGLGTAWGFEYVTGFPWIKLEGEPSQNLFGELRVKPVYGTGWWTRGCSEPMLIFKKDEARAPRTDLVGLLSEQYAHSRKPENIYHVAEQMPGPYLELFARRRRDGWTTLGNEIDGKDLLTALTEVAA